MENAKITRIQRLSGTATVIVWAAQALLAATVVMSVVSYAAGQYTPGMVLTGASSLAGVAGLLLLFSIILKLLGSLKKGRTPFEAENVKKLKRASLVLGILAALQLLTDAIAASTLNIIQAPDAQGLAVATRTVAFHYSTLVLLVLGLVVYCMALAFQYGAELQQQSDETL